MKPTYALLVVDKESDICSFTPLFEAMKHGTPLLLKHFADLKVKGTEFHTGDCTKIDPNLLKQKSISIKMPAVYDN